MNILHIDSSILADHSVSRALTADIVAKELTLHPGATVTYRDLALVAPRHFSAAHLQPATAVDADIAADIALGDAFLAELFAADIIVIGAPMYNLTIPSQLKAWIDRVVAAGKTFRYNAQGQVESLLPAGKKIIIASSRGGGYGPGTPAAAYEHQESYLRAVLGFIGLTDVSIVRAEGLALGADAKAAALTAARDDIAGLAA